MKSHWCTLRGRPLSKLLKICTVLVFILLLGIKYHAKHEFEKQEREREKNQREKEDILQREKEKRLEEHKMRTEIDVYKWNENPTKGCEGHFQGFGEEFVRLKFARVNPITKTFFLPCKSKVPDYKFQHGYEGTPLTSWLDNMITYLPSLKPQLELINKTTIAIYRIEAHNLYHTMCEWYNVYLLSKLQNFDPSKVMILFMDDRPLGHMDETWTVLFRTVLKRPLGLQYAFTDLFWNIIGYESPMNHHYIKTLPHLEEFTDFFLKSFGITNTKALDCSNLTVTIFLRRDYMTHPERMNMTGGLVHRKFKNEDDIINMVRNVFHSSYVNLVVLEKLPMKRQLEIATKTDILIGMHGAGMAHILFLPKHAVIFEMFPKYWGFFHHFKAMARWRNLKYFGWQNTNNDYEYPGFYTLIPISVLKYHYTKIKQHLCGA